MFLLWQWLVKHRVATLWSITYFIPYCSLNGSIIYTMTTVMCWRRLKDRVIFSQTSIQSDLVAPLLVIRKNTGLSHFRISFTFQTLGFLPLCCPTVFIWWVLPSSTTISSVTSSGDKETPVKMQITPMWVINTCHVRKYIVKKDISFWASFVSFLISGFTFTASLHLSCLLTTSRLELSSSIASHLSLLCASTCMYVCE